MIINVKPRKKKNETVEDYNKRVIKELYNDGYHIKEIAKKLNIDEIEVYNHATNGRKITTNAEREEMIKLFNQGYSYCAIAKKLNKSRSCVKTRIESKAKFNCGKYDDITYKQLKKMKTMAKNGASMEKISEEVGIKLSSVIYRLSHSDIITHTTRVSKEERDTFISLYILR